MTIIKKLFPNSASFIPIKEPTCKNPTFAPNKNKVKPINSYIQPTKTLKNSFFDIRIATI